MVNSFGVKHLQLKHVSHYWKSCGTLLKIEWIVSAEGGFCFLLIFVVAYNDLNMRQPFKKKKEVDRGKSWKMFCSHVESVPGLMLMGYNMENHRIHPLYWSSKTAHPLRSPLFFFLFFYSFIPVNLISEDTMNQGFCSGCLLLSFLYFSSLFPLLFFSLLLLHPLHCHCACLFPFFRILSFLSSIPSSLCHFLISIYRPTCDFPVLSFFLLLSTVSQLFYLFIFATCSFSMTCLHNLMFLTMHIE